MNPSLDSLSRGLFAAVILLSFLPAGAQARCDPPWIDNLYNAGTVSHIGHAIVEGGTVMSRGGQTFVTGCQAQLGYIRVMVTRPGAVNRDIEPITQGDRLRCEVFDADRNLIMESIAPYPYLSPAAEVHFLFWDHEIELAAGEYSFLVSTVDPAYAYLNWGEEYADGTYQQDWLGYWLNYPARDAVFRVYLEPNSGFVATEQQSFGGIKALYRQARPRGHVRLRPVRGLGETRAGNGRAPNPSPENNFRRMQISDILDINHQRPPSEDSWPVCAP